MAEATSFRINRISDADLIGALEAIDLAVNHQGSAGKYSIWLGPSGPQIGATTLTNLMHEKGVAELVAFGKTLLCRATLNLSSSNKNATIDVKRKEEGFDLVEIQFTQETPFPFATSVTLATRSAFEKYDPAGHIESLLGGQLAEFYRKRDETLRRLEEWNEKLNQQSLDYRARLDSQLAERIAALESGASNERARLADEHSAKMAELRQKEEALAEEKKGLDDRSSRHARRHHLQSLKDILAEHSRKFVLTKETASKRQPVHAVFIALGAVLAVNLFTALQEYVRDGANWSLPHAVRLTLSTAAFLGVAVYYIRWNDNWFRQHADEEFRLKRLGIDLDRASWVVELALEWKDEEGREIPSELIDRLTKNLFDDPSLDRGAHHPAEDLAAMVLGASSGIKLQIPGVAEATINRRGIRKMQRDAKKVESR